MSDEELPEAVSNEENSASLTSDAPPLTFKERIKGARPETLLPKVVQNKLGGLSRIAASFLILLVAGGVGYGGFLAIHHPYQPKQHFIAKVTPFNILSTAPSKDAYDLKNVNKIVINFNKPVDPSKLKGDFWITPQIDGSFSQTSSNQAIFTPTLPLQEGTDYQVMIHKEFTSKSGTALGADYYLNFQTATPNHVVIFQSGDTRPAFGSAQVGLPHTYTLSVGQDVDSTGEIQVFKTDQDQLLSILGSSAEGNQIQSYGNVTVDQQVDTSGMSLIQDQKGFTDGSSFTVNLPIGIYFIVANNEATQVGATWLVVTNLGVALRQDDQKVVVAVSDLTTSQSAKADIKLYNFESGADPIGDSTIDGVGSIDLPYTQEEHSAWAIATTSDDLALVPLNITYSLADRRINQNLATSTQSFGLTDKPTYSIGETVHFSGFVFSDNDVHYRAVANRELKLQVSESKWGGTYTETTVTSDSNGQVKGSFVVTSDWLQSHEGIDGRSIVADSDNFGIYVEDNSSDLDFLQGSQLASFTVVRSKFISKDVIVKFSKRSYVATDAVSANIAVKNPDGTPFANGDVSVGIYADNYDESSTLPLRVISDSPGELLTDRPMQIRLDAKGQATLPVSTPSIPAGSSQVITVQATTAADVHGKVAAGGASVVVHQGLGKLVFGPSRGVLAPDGTLVSRVYAMASDNSPIAGAIINYKVEGKHWTYDSTGLGTSATVEIGSGSVTADANGFAQITQAIGGFGNGKGDDSSISLSVSTGDKYNDEIDNSAPYYVEQPGANAVHSDLQLSSLDISGSPTALSVGQTVDLTVTAPADIHALVAIDRGRIYKYETVDLKEGVNTYSVVVTPDMLPSFNLSFSYFLKGEYSVEGQTFNVSPTTKLTSVSITPDQKSYTAGDTSTISIRAKDATGNPVASNLMIGVVSEKMYRLNDQPVAAIQSLYQPRDMTITSSSSLTSIGSGGPGGCGGGGNGYDGSKSLLNPLGTSIYWKPSMSTGADGAASVQLKIPKGTWRVFVYSIDQAVNVGSSYIDVTAK